VGILAINNSFETYLIIRELLMIMEIKLIKENEKGKTYQANGFKILYRYKDKIAGDNDNNVEELIYFMTGSAEITLKDKIWTIESPAKVEFPANTYHKIKALTDISLILLEK
jgi:mannose-6-phosphate isomerase-like protein (cupin superfamily)